MHRQRIAKPDARFPAIVLFFAATAAFSGWSREASAQLTVDAGAFRVQFWDAADGNHVYGSENIAAADLGTWTAEQRAATVRAFEYWSARLGAGNTPAANAPVIRVIIDTTYDDANARSTLNESATPSQGGASLGKTNTIARIAEGTSPGRVNGLDGRVRISPNTLAGGTDRVTQLIREGAGLERTMIHEIGHLLGISASGGGGPSTDGTNENEVFTSQLDTNDDFAGPNALATFGQPIDFQVNDTHPLLDFHNITRARPFDKNFRNIAIASPAELSIIRDLGYTGLNLNEQFGTAIYQDGTGALQSINTDFNSTQDFATGLFLQGQNRVITINGDMTISGYAGTGIRIAGRADDDIATRQAANTITIGPDSTINVSGENGIGVLASSGANNILIHRGELNVDGENGVGILLDFGFFVNASRQVSSEDYDDFLIRRIDITGSISAENGDGDVIRITDTAAVEEINLMRGTVLNGSIFSDAQLIDRNDFASPVLTFGRAADGNGAATDAADADFSLVFEGDITGTSGSAVLDLRFVGGTTTLNGKVAVEDVQIDGGENTTNNDLSVEGINVDGGTTTFNGITYVDDDLVVNDGTLISTNRIDVDEETIVNGGLLRFLGDANLDDVGVFGGVLEVGTGHTSADEFFLFDGGTTNVDGFFTASSVEMTGGDFNVAGMSQISDTFDMLDGEVSVEGALQVTNAFTMSNGTTTVASGGNLSAGSFALVQGTLTSNGGTTVAGAFEMTDGSVGVGSLGFLSADSLTMQAGQVDVFGALNVANAYTQVDGLTFVGTNGHLTAGSYLLQAGTTDVDGSMGIDGLFNATGGTAIVNGFVSADEFLVGQSARLQGTGAIQVANGLTNSGVIAPGNSIGTLTIVGDFVNESTGVIEIEMSPVDDRPGIDNDLLLVTGAATINGGTVDVIDEPGTFAVANRYLFLQAGSLAVNELPTIVEDIVDRRLISFIDDRSYSLLVARDVPYVSLGQTQNQLAFGGYLDQVALDPDVQYLRDVLDLIPEEDTVRLGYDQLSGEIYGTHLTTKLQSTSRFLDLVRASTRNAGTCDGFGYDGDGMSSWYSGYGWTGFAEGDGNARGVDVANGGVAVGLSKRLSNNVMTGMFYGYESLTSDSSALRSRVESDVHRFGVYGEMRTEGAQYVRVAGMGGYADNRSSRVVNIQNPFFGINERPTGDYTGWSGAVDLEVGQCLAFESFDLQPLVGLRYANLNQEGFTETNGGITNLIVDDASLDSLRSRVGTRFTYHLPQSRGTSVFLDTAWHHELLGNTAGRYNAALAVADQTSFAAEGVHYDRNRAVISPGVAWDFNWVRVVGQYQADFNRMSVFHSGTGSVEFLW